MLSFFQDLRYALRILLKSPGFTIVAVLILALGIGANVATFSVVYGVLLRPLPFPQSEQLVRVFDDLRGPGEQDFGVSAPGLWDLQGSSRRIEFVGQSGFEAYRKTQRTVIPRATFARGTCFFFGLRRKADPSLRSG